VLDVFTIKAKPKSKGEGLKEQEKEKEKKAPASRKRKLIIDDTTEIPAAQMQRQLKDTSDITVTVS
jgi:hypothetical protein